MVSQPSVSESPAASLKLTRFNVETEINFYFGCMGLFLLVIYNFAVTDNYMQLIQLVMDPVQGQAAIAWLVTSGILSVTITLSMLSVIILAGPIIVNVIGNIKDIVLTYLGFALFNDQELTMVVALGLAVSFCGASHTLITKFKQMK